MDTFCIIKDSWNSKKYKICKIEYSYDGEKEYCFNGKIYYERNFSKENIIVISYNVINFEDLVKSFIERLMTMGFVYTKNGVNVEIDKLRNVLNDIFRESRFVISL